MSAETSTHNLLRILGGLLLLLVLIFAVLSYKVLNPDTPPPPLQAANLLSEQHQPVDSTRMSSDNPRYGVPVRIMIPRIGVDAAIETVSITSEGAMGTPQDPLNAGWYELGPRPGEIGSAVLDGHVDWYDGAVGVFENLHKLKPGDRITVQDEQGDTNSFIVRDIHVYDAAADAIDIFRSTDDTAHLNIITCDGVWDKQANQYPDRLVVFADKVVE